MTTYVITLSRNFTLKHPRHGEPTGFCESTLNAILQTLGVKSRFPEFGMKLHTIRGNYPLWVKRFRKIERGQAILSIRYWSGMPYNSKQFELCRMGRNDGIGLQMLWFRNGNLCAPIIDSKSIDMERIAKNDGLNVNDWYNWFVKEDLHDTFAIIHFTSFRY